MMSAHMRYANASLIYRDCSASPTACETATEAVQLLYSIDLPLIAPSQTNRLTPI
jgi:hypothetical protein